MPRKAVYVQANTFKRKLTLFICSVLACFYCLSSSSLNFAFAQDASSIVADSQSKVTLSSLREKYKGPADVRFEIDFSREHSALAMPLKFSASYYMKGQELLWSVFRPFKSDVRKLSFGVSEKIDGADPEQIKIDKVALSIGAIVGMKWGEIFGDFNVRASENGMMYLPKPESGLSYIKEVSVSFYDNLRPKILNVQFEDGKLSGIVRWFDFTSRTSQEGLQQ